MAVRSNLTYEFFLTDLFPVSRCRQWRKASAHRSRMRALFAIDHEPFAQVGCQLASLSCISLNWCFPSLHVAPADHRPTTETRYNSFESSFSGVFCRVRLVTGPRSIRALACPGTPVLADHSSRSDSYAFRSTAASSRTCPARSSRILVQHAGWN